MAQFLRPDSTITQTNWTDGGFAEINGASANDATRAFSQSLGNNGTARLEVGLSDPAGKPGGGTTTFRFRIAKGTVSGSTLTLDAAGRTVTITPSVYQGGTLIAAGSAETATGTWTTFDFTPDMSSVTDWNDVRMRFDILVTGGGAASANRAGAISWAELEAPDPSRRVIVIS